MQTAWDAIQNLLFPACVWGGHLGAPQAGSPTKPTRAARFRLALEVLEPRMALAANPLVGPLVPTQPFVLGDVPHAEQGLHADATTLGSSVVNVTQQAQPAYRVEARNTAGLMVAIYGRDAGSDAWDVFAQRYDAAGQVEGDALQVNNLSRGQQGEWSVAIDQQGDFVVAWSGRGQGTASLALGVYARRFGADGVSAADEVQANATDLTALNRPDVAMGGDIFAVAWSGLTSQGTGGVFARRFDATGGALGSEIQVTSDPVAAQQSPAVAIAADGQFVVAWAGATGDGGHAIFLQAFDADGLASGAAAQVTRSSQQAPTLRDLVLDARGNAVVSWSASPTARLHETQVTGLLAKPGTAADGEEQLTLPTAVNLWEPGVGQHATDGLGSGKMDHHTLVAAASATEIMKQASDGHVIDHGDVTGRADGTISNQRQLVASHLTGRAFASNTHDKSASDDKEGEGGGATSRNAQQSVTTSEAERKHGAPDQSRELPAPAIVLDAPVSEPPLNAATPPPTPRAGRSFGRKEGSKPK